MSLHGAVMSIYQVVLRHHFYNNFTSNDKHLLLAINQTISQSVLSIVKDSLCELLTVLVTFDVSLCKTLSLYTLFG